MKRDVLECIDKKLFATFWPQRGKTCFLVSDKVKFKSACSATETSLKIEIFPVASLDMILSNKQITKALIRLCRCAGWSALLLFASPPKQIFLCRGSIIGGALWVKIRYTSQMVTSLIN